MSHIRFKVRVAPASSSVSSKQMIRVPSRGARPERVESRTGCHDCRVRQVLLDRKLLPHPPPLSCLLACSCIFSASHFFHARSPSPDLAAAAVHVLIAARAR